MKTLSLYELNNRVVSTIRDAFDRPYWITAELSEVRTAGNGHCYVEFIDKSEKTGTVSARARGTIWAQRWFLLRESFERETGQRFTAGIKVLVEVQVTMHAVYGYTLDVLDLDPSYTMGEMARQRAAILRQLAAEGILEMNKELEMPLLPQRIAVISASNAAGYGDFRHQLTHNDRGFAFYTRLFPAIMQGEKTEGSIIAALDRIYRIQEHFDVVVIIRGGGATADLASFDSYAIAANCAQFPLPVIVGIGHERDNTVLDLVAHTSVKTPTAVAALLIDRMKEQGDRLERLKNTIVTTLQGTLQRETARLDMLAAGLPQWVDTRKREHRIRLRQIILHLRQSHLLLTRQLDRLEFLQERLSAASAHQLERRRQQLQWIEQRIEISRPENILRRGFSITRIGGRAITSATEIKKGDRVVTQVAEGSFSSVVEEGRSQRAEEAGHARST